LSGFILQKCVRKGKMKKETGGTTQASASGPAQNSFPKKKVSRIPLVGIDFLGYIQIVILMNLSAYEEFVYSPVADGPAGIVFGL